MPEYIERDFILPNGVFYSNADNPEKSIDELLERINSAPAVDIVRCKDCAVPHNKWLGCPNLNGLIPPPDFYCARGERKDGEGDA